MEIQRLRIGAFGCLRNVDTGPEPLPSLVVVDGPNEAGKSTFFHFLTATLYGFYPASSETNPRGPWDGAEIEGDAIVRLSDGQLWEIHRRLQRTPFGSLRWGSLRL